MATSTKSRLIKDKQAKDELQTQVGTVKRFLKGLTSPAREQPKTSKVHVLMSCKEVDDLNEMKRKVQMFYNWVKFLKIEVEELLSGGYKYMVK